MKRRDFLKAGSLSATGLVCFPATAAPAAPAAEPYDIPADPTADFFSGRERQVLSALADQIYPGAGSLGAARFFEQLLTAFDQNPPRIYAGENGQWIPLDRIQDRTWRLILFGGAGPNGPVTGLRNQIKEILAKASKILLDLPWPFSIASAAAAWSALSIEQQQVMTELTMQSVFADPIYGGNANGEGWKAIHFPGPSLPQGYSNYEPSTGKYRERPEAPLSMPDPGSDPAPVDLITMLFLRMKGI